MLNRFLRDLERELARRLPDADVRAKLAEVEFHLREEVQARFDLGIEREMAEAEAIAAFGDPRRFARAIRRGDDFGLERWKWLAAIGLALAVSPLLGYTPLYFVPLLLVAVTLAGFARTSFRARRPAKLSVAIALIAIVATPILYGIGLSHGGFGSASRRVLVDAPRAVLPPSGKAILDAAYESRFALALALGVPVATDLLFAGLGGATRSRRRRVVA